MAISYTEKGVGLHEYIESQGESLWQADGVWYSSNDAVVQPMIDSFDQLAYEKQQKIKAIKIEGATKASSIYAFLESDPEKAIDFYDFAEDLYLSISAGSREPLSGRLLQFKDIYDAGVAAIQTVNAMTTVAEVLAYDAVNDPAWPV